MDSISASFCLICVLLTLQVRVMSVDACEPPVRTPHQAILETEVISAELVERRYAGTRLPYSVRFWLGEDHSALRVTLVSGAKCVVQKGDHRATTVGTTVTCDDHVVNSTDWNPVTRFDFNSWPYFRQPVVKKFYGVTVDAMIEEGGQGYSEESDNCHTTANKLLGLGVDPRDQAGSSTDAPHETCMCVNGQNVNARASPSMASIVVASLGSSDCHVYNGGDADADGYKWRQLQNINGNSAWVAVNFLVDAPAYRCASIQQGTSTCFCVSGALKVNARSGPLVPAGDQPTNVVAKLRKRECHIHAGGSVMAGGITWHELKDVKGVNAWVSKTYLTQSSPAACKATSPHGHECTNPDAKELACKILEQHNNDKLKLARCHPSGQVDRAFAFNNIEHACAGRAAARSSYKSSPCNDLGGPGGYVCLTRELLQYIHEINTKHYILVNEIAGAVHGCASLHYDGKAVDLHNDASGTEYYISHCNSKPAPLKCYSYLENGNHVHTQFKFETH